MFDSTVIEREPSSETRIRMRDCDAFGHLHNTRYLDEVMDAREDHLRTFYGFEFGPYAAKTGTSWVVATSHSRYYRPLRAGDKARVVTRLIDADARSLTVEGRIYTARGDLAYLAWVTFRHVTLADGRATDHLADFSDFAYPLVWPVAESAFDERARALAPQKAAA